MYICGIQYRLKFYLYSIVVTSQICIQYIGLSGSATDPEVFVDVYVKIGTFL
jgi:hypothetical protein